MRKLCASVFVLALLLMLGSVTQAAIVVGPTGTSADSNLVHMGDENHAILVAEPAGSASGTIQIFQANGHDLWGNSDRIAFAYQDEQVTGDAVIAARVQMIAHGGGWSRAGIQFRGSLDANAQHFSASFATANDRLTAGHRHDVGGGTHRHCDGPMNLGWNPVWLRVGRVGNVFTPEYSLKDTDIYDDVDDWAMLGCGSDAERTVNMPETVYVGIQAHGRGGASSNYSTANFWGFAGALAQSSGVWTAIPDIEGQWEDPATWTAPEPGTIPDDKSDVIVGDEVFDAAWVTIGAEGSPIDAVTVNLSVGGSAELDIAPGSSLTVSKDTVSYGVMVVDGGEFTTGSLALNADLDEEVYGVLEVLGDGVANIGTLTIADEVEVFPEEGTVNVSEAISIGTEGGDMAFLDMTYGAAWNISTAAVDLNSGTLVPDSVLNVASLNLAGGEFDTGMLDELNVAGALSLNMDLDTSGFDFSAGSVNVNDAATLTFTSPQDLAVLNIDGTGAIAHNNNNITVTSSLGLTGGADLDMGTARLFADGADISVGADSVLTVSSDTTAQTINVNGGTLVPTNGSAFLAANFIFNGDQDINFDIVDINPGNAAESTGVTVKGGTVNINGTGVSEDQTYEGATIVSGGKLVINAPVPNTAFVGIDGGDMEINAPLTTPGFYEGDPWFYGFYDDTSIDPILADMTGIDDGIANGADGGLFNRTPDDSDADFSGDVWRGTSFSDTYAEMWTGNWKAPKTGTYSIWTRSDDWHVFWLDKDQNGEFEAGQGELLSNNTPPEGWNTEHTETVDLIAGQIYKVATAFGENGGGDFYYLEVTDPDGQTYRINPGARPSEFGTKLGPAITVANGQLDINAAVATQYVNVNGGGVANANATVAASEVNIAAGGVYNANVAGSVGSPGAAVGVSGTLNVLSDGAGLGVNISMNQGGFIQVENQTSVANYPGIALVAGSGLGGDLTFARFSGAEQNVTLAENAVLAVAPGAAGLPVRGVDPLNSDVQDAILYHGMLGIGPAADPSEEYNVGDDAAASIFKGVAIGGWTAAGNNFEATVNDISAAPQSGIDILLLESRDLTINGTTSLNTTNTDVGANFNGGGSSILTVPTGGWGGTATTVTRTGNYDDADGSGLNTTGDGILRLETGSVGDGMTVRVEKGVVDTRAEDVLAPTGTLVIGEYAGLYLDDNPDNNWGADRIMQGHVKIEANAIVLIDGDQNRFENGTTTWDFDPDMYLAPRDNTVLENLYDGLAGRMTGSLDNVNYMIGMADQIRQIRMGAGRRLTKAWNQNDRTHDNNASITKSLTNDPTGSFVIFSSPGGGNNTNGGAGGDLNLDCQIFLAGVDIYINDAVDSDVRIDHIYNENDMTRRRLKEDGRVDIDRKTVEFDDMVVRNGFLRLGDNNDFNINSTGMLDIWGPSRVELMARFDNFMKPEFTDGSLFPDGIFVAKGADLRVWYDRNEAGGYQVDQKIVMRGEGEGLNYLYIRNSENGGMRDIWFNDLTLEEGAHLGIDRDRLGRDHLKLNLKLEGDATIQRAAWGSGGGDTGGDGMSFNNLTNTGPNPTVTLKVGDRPGGAIGNDRHDSNFYGLIGDGVIVEAVNMRPRFRAGADLAPTAIVRSRGTYVDGTPSGTGRDGDRIHIFTGENGVDPITGGTFELSGFDELRIRVNDAASGDPIVNEFGATVRFMYEDRDWEVWDGTNRSGLLRTQRSGGDTGINGMATVAKISLQEQAQAALRGYDQQTLEVKEVFLEGTGDTNAWLFIRDHDDDRVVVGDVTGDPDNLLRIRANRVFNMNGTLNMDVLLVNNGNSRLRIRDGFDLNGNTITVPAREHHVYADPGVGTIVAQGGSHIRLMVDEPDVAAETITQMISSTINSEGNVTLRSDRPGADLAGDPGTVIIDTLNVGDASVVTHEHDDGTHLGYSNLNLGAAGTVNANGDVLTLDTLTGVGSVINGTVIMAGGGSLAPGSSPGTLEVSNLTMSDTSTYELELGALGQDMVNVTGDLTLDDMWNLELIGTGGGAAPDEPVMVMSYTGNLNSTMTGDSIDSDILSFVNMAGWDTASAELKNDAAGKYLYVFGLASPEAWSAESGVFGVGTTWDTGVVPEQSTRVRVVDGDGDLAGDVVTVATGADQAAFTAAIDLGELVVDDGGKLTVGNRLDVADQSLTVNGELVVGGVINTAGTTTFGGTATGNVSRIAVTGGTTTIGGTAELSIGTVDPTGGTTVLNGLGAIGTLNATDAAATVGIEGGVVATLNAADDVAIGGTGTVMVTDTANLGSFAVITTDGSFGLSGADLTSDAGDPAVGLTLSSGEVSLRPATMGIDYAIYKGFPRSGLSEADPPYDNSANAGYIDQVWSIDNDIDGDLLNGGIYAPDTLATIVESGPWTGEIAIDTDDDDFVFVWSGYYTAPETGTYEFQLNANNAGAIWMDFDRDGEYTNWIVEEEQLVFWDDDADPETPDVPLIGRSALGGSGTHHPLDGAGHRDGHHGRVLREDRGDSGRLHRSRW